MAGTNQVYPKFAENRADGTLGDLFDVTGDRDYILIPLTVSYTYSAAHSTVADLTNEVAGDAQRATLAGVDKEIDEDDLYITTTTDLATISSGAAITYRKVALALKTAAANDATSYLVSLFTFDADQTGTQVSLTSNKTPVGDANFIHKTTVAETVYS